MGQIQTRGGGEAPMQSNRCRDRSADEDDMKRINGRGDILVRGLRRQRLGHMDTKFKLGDDS